MIASARKGFIASERTTGLLGIIGPLYVRRDGDGITNGFAIDDRHLNSRDFVHGRTIATGAAAFAITHHDPKEVT